MISAERLRPVWPRRTLDKRSSAALRTAVVTVSPVNAASSRTNFSVAGSLILRGMEAPWQKIYVNKDKELRPQVNLVIRRPHRDRNVRRKPSVTIAALRR